jgi:hypothetical protein
VVRLLPRKSWDQNPHFQQVFNHTFHTRAQSSSATPRANLKVAFPQIFFLCLCKVQIVQIPKDFLPGNLGQIRSTCMFVHVLSNWKPAHQNLGSLKLRFTRLVSASSASIMTKSGENTVPNSCRITRLRKARQHRMSRAFRSDLQLVNNRQEAGGNIRNTTAGLNFTKRCGAVQMQATGPNMAQRQGC